MHMTNKEIGAAMTIKLDYDLPEYLRKGSAVPPCAT